MAITGATGFLGSNIAESLIADGVDVRIFARDKEKARQFEGRAAKIVVGEIDDQQAVRQLMEGASDVIHLVSNFRTASGPAESYERINVEGTRLVLEEAERAGIKRFVHCSTIGVHGDVLEVPTKETSPFNPGDLYQTTKLDAEKLAQSAIEKSAMEVVIVRPCSLYG
ncbi:MAG: NAD-dependent epimerase/dehydratase family protein, partial [Pseudomonadales bacterium]